MNCSTNLNTETVREGGKKNLHSFICVCLTTYAVTAVSLRKQQRETKEKWRMIEEKGMRNKDKEAHEHEPCALSVMKLLMS